MLVFRTYNPAETEHGVVRQACLHSHSPNILSRTCGTSEGCHATLQVDVQLDIESIPIMDGALECADSGVASSLLPSNLKAAALVGDAQEAAKLRPWPLLFDPQTSGGLLAG